MTSLDTTIRLLVSDMFRKSWGRWSFPQCYQNHSCDTSIFMICHIMSGNGYKKVQRPFGIDLVTPDMFRTPWRKWSIPQCCISRSYDISNFMICGNNNENKCSGHPWPFWTGITISREIQGSREITRSLRTIQMDKWVVCQSPVRNGSSDDVSLHRQKHGKREYLAPF